MFSFVGDTVLDPFVGSGITLYNALRLNRVAWGIDINRRYIDYIYHNLSAGLVDIFSDNQQP
jgi:DNA modification methylase